MAERKPSKRVSEVEKNRRRRQAAGQAVGTKRPEPAQQHAPEGAISGDAFRERRLGEDVELPSGLWCKAKRIGMEALVQGGKIPNTLLPIVMEALEEGEAGRKRAEEKLRSQMSAAHIEDMMAMYDGITMFVVVEPTIRPIPEKCPCGAIKSGESVIATDQNKDHEHGWRPVPDQDREHGSGIAYVDWIDFQDKVYLMNFAVGGTRDLETFRQEQSQLLDSLSAGKDLSL
jgi:hypothetical protein